MQDSAGARLLLPQLAARYPTVCTVYADGGYQGKLLDWAGQVLGMQMSIIKRTMPKGFQVLPKRWVVERTLAWLGWHRRLSKDYELNPESAQCFLFLAAAMILLRRTPSS